MFNKRNSISIYVVFLLIPCGYHAIFIFQGLTTCNINLWFLIRNYPTVVPIRKQFAFQLDCFLLDSILAGVLEFCSIGQKDFEGYSLACFHSFL